MAGLSAVPIGFVQMHKSLELAASAAALIGFLEVNRSTRRIRFPFAYSFPQNCCEGASRIFSYLVAEKYDRSAEVIKGTKPRKNEHHFWVRCEGLLYDLTAHQFSGRRPILGAERHSFLETFPLQVVSENPEFIDQRRVLELFRSGAIVF